MHGSKDANYLKSKLPEVWILSSPSFESLDFTKPKPLPVLSFVLFSIQAMPDLRVPVLNEMHASEVRLEFHAEV